MHSPVRNTLQYSLSGIKLRRLSGVLQLLNLQEASVAAGEYAIDFAREQANRYIDLREELVTLTAIAHLHEADFDKVKSACRRNHELPS